MELNEAVKAIIEAFGKEIIAEKRFVYILADKYSFRDNPAERRVLSVLVNEGYSAQFLNIKPDGNITLLTKQIINELCVNYGYRQELVANAVSSIVKGLNYAYLGPVITDLEAITPYPKEEKCDYKRNKYYLKASITGLHNKELIVYSASGYYNERDGSFLILKGSLLAYQNFEQGWLLSKDELFRKRVIDLYCQWKRPHFVVISDIVCKTPNEAILIVIGKRGNGMILWEDSSRKCLYQNL